MELVMREYVLAIKSLLLMVTTAVITALSLV